MPRPRTPTAVLKLTGRLKHDRKRYADRDHEPEPTPGLGDPPECLNEAQAARWRDLVEMCAAGVLTRQDRIAAELLCRLWQAVRDGIAEPAEKSLFARLFGQFGLTPAERSKVQVPKPMDRGNPFSEVG